MDRPKTREDRQEDKAIRDSLKVSSYTDEIFESLTTGQPVKTNIVPNYGDPLASQRSKTNESGGFSIFDMSTVIDANDVESAFQSEQNVNVGMTKQASSNANQLKVSQNQLAALQKYPALIDLLGTDHGDSLVNEIVVGVNKMVVANIEQNTKDACTFTKGCQADRKNIKGYFVGEDEAWACVVIASGPFRGDEAFHFNPEKDQASILRKKGDDYENVTSQFNVVHEYSQSP